VIAMVRTVVGTFVVIKSPVQQERELMGYKLKTNKAASKRFQFTASGKVKFKRAGKRHCLGHRAQKNKVNLRHSGTLSDADVPRVEKLLPNG